MWAIARSWVTQQPNTAGNSHDWLARLTNATQQTTLMLYNPRSHYLQSH
jgi:hypothetical protein